MVTIRRTDRIEGVDTTPYEIWRTNRDSFATLPLVDLVIGAMHNGRALGMGDDYSGFNAHTITKILNKQALDLDVDRTFNEVGTVMADNEGEKGRRCFRRIKDGRYVLAKRRT